MGITDNDFMTDLLADSERPDKIAKDLHTIASAISHRREGWGVSADVRAIVLDRLKKVAERSSVPVPMSTPNGPEFFERQDVADANAIAAARVLAAIDAIDQEDYWKTDTNERLDAGKRTANVGITPIAHTEIVAHSPDKLPEGESEELS